jgi:uncharacterized protein YlzI (FlbEa/FlbD family)
MIKVTRLNWLGYPDPEETTILINPSHIVKANGFEKTHYETQTSIVCTYISFVDGSSEIIKESLDDLYTLLTSK